MSPPKTTEKSDVSIYSVAEEAGVSIVSVSRVFNDYPHVSRKMRTRVFEAARRIGYMPRLVSKPRVIAVLVGHLHEISSGEFKSKLMLRLIEESAKNGLLIEFIPADRAELATKNLVEGIVEFGLTSPEVELLDDLPPVPSITVNKLSPTSMWHSVRSDHFAEGKLSAEHLLSHGHRKLSLVLDEPNGWSAEERLRGFSEVVQKCSGATLVTGFAEGESVEGMAQKIVDGGCTACALLTDNVGLQLLSEIQNIHQKSIPQDISVITLEHSNVSAFHSPPLTTIHQPLNEIASCVIHTLERLIDGRPVDEALILQSELIERESVKTLS